MSRAARASIDLDAIRHNYRLAKSQAPAARAAAIIKAGAYGHGAVAVAGALKAEADAFGVACIEEAIELRDAGIEQPVVLLEGFFEADELEYIARHNLWTAIHSPHQVEALARAQLPAPVNVWLKMDSGMHRLGIEPENLRATYDRLRSLGQVAEITLMSHFACADELDLETTRQQIACFDRAVEGIDAPHSLSNSPATLAWPEAHRDWLRPGLMLYGATPFLVEQEQAARLEAAMTLTSEIIAIHDLQPGDAVGYGAGFVCERPSRIATVAMGYGDGYPRHAANGTPVVVNGQRTVTAGRVSMDMMTIDITDIPGAGIGDRVELWGKQLPVSEVAVHCSTIPYTLLTCLTPRVPRVYE
ncbi:alanine racemase [Marinobacterium nitratireducens]|uniref:Alanine racemase n=1 Tax=Marinobacterium nitratireducens TaxID=518897 RepID=A0A918DW65_9GAMM|nr:alanine racemase [Marinobacterium nitratireducens]GGO87298.1 alanine racemase [Marinobacterium nitratireducens]